MNSSTVIDLAARRSTSNDEPARVVIVVENASVPTDLRISSHARSLAEAGHEVTVICPTGAEHEQKRREVTDDGIEIRRFPLKRAEDGIGAYLVEYATALMKGR